MAVAKAGGSAGWSVLSGIATMAAGTAATTATAMTGMTGRTEGARSGSEHRFSEFGRKPLKFSGFLPFRGRAKGRENSLQLAGHRGIALLNDALLRRLFRTKSGRIAQLV